MINSASVIISPIFRKSIIRGRTRKKLPEMGKTSSIWLHLVEEAYAILRATRQKKEDTLHFVTFNVFNVAVDYRLYSRVLCGPSLLLVM